MDIVQKHKCIFTDLVIETFVQPEDFQNLGYIVEINNKKHKVLTSQNAFEWDSTSNFFRENKWLFHCLLYNDNWFEDEGSLITIEKLEALISQ